MIESKRVKIYPANKEQMENQIASENDPELKKAYKEMLQGCIDHPDLWDWYATEAASLAIKWAFNHPEVKAVDAKQPLTQVFLAHIKMHTRTIIFTCNYIIYFFYIIPF